MKKISNKEISQKADEFATKWSSNDKEFMQQRRAFRAGMLQSIKILNGEIRENGKSVCPQCGSNDFKVTRTCKHCNASILKSN